MSEPPSSLSGSAYLRLVGLGAVIGILAAFLAALFLAVVHDVERWLRDSLPSALGRSAPPWYLVIALGSVMGMVVVLSGAFGEREQSVLASAGSFSAISALFGGPIVGGMMRSRAASRSGRRSSRS